MLWVFKPHTSRLIPKNNKAPRPWCGFIIIGQQQRHQTHAIVLRPISAAEAAEANNNNEPIQKQFDENQSFNRNALVVRFDFFSIHFTLS